MGWGVNNPSGGYLDKLIGIFLIFASVGQFQNGLVVSGIGAVTLGATNLFFGYFLKRFQLDYRKALIWKSFISLVSIVMIITPYIM